MVLSNVSHHLWRPVYIYLVYSQCPSYFSVRKLLQLTLEYLSQLERFWNIVGLFCFEVWGLSIHQLLYAFPGEHARSSFFKHIGQGVTQLHVDGAARLFSCGADGSMKVRQLPERELTVHSLY